MITFLTTLMVHCFGRRPVDEVIWIIVMMLGALEIMITGLMIGEMLK